MGEGGHGQPAAVTLVVGPEELLVDRAVSEVVAAARAGDPETDVRELAAAGLEPGTVSGFVAPSLFGGRTVVVVRGVHEAGDALVDELKGLVSAPSPDAVLVLTHKGGARGKGVLDAARKAGATEVACAEVKSRRDKASFVAAEFSRHRRRVGGEVVETLLDAVGNDLRALAGAVGQLCADTTGAIDVDVVRRYYAGHAEVTGFTVADRAVEGRADEALLQLRYALGSGTDPVPVVAALAMALRNIGRMSGASRGLREADLARELGMPPWKVRVVRGQLRGWTADGLAAALRAVAEADAAVKGGAADPVYALEKAVVTVARCRQQQ